MKTGVEAARGRHMGNGNGKRSIGSFLLLVLKLEITMLVALVFSVAGVMGGIILGYVNTTKDVTGEFLNKRFIPAVVYDSKGNEYDTLYNGMRIWTRLEDIPDNLENAFIAIEDERFWDHSGIDPIRIFGVTYKLFTQGRVVGGASTITQQVVKNITGDNELSLKRKVQEQWKALQLEKVADKKEILEQYLNLVYLGDGINGVGAAARVYFDKNASELTLAECASLAAIARRPAITGPFENKENNRNIRDIVLAKMLELEYIKKDEYNKAVKEDIITRKGSLKNASVIPFFIEEVLEEVKQDLMETRGYSAAEAWDLIESGGLKIYSTLDPDMQNIVDSVFQDEDRYFPVYNQGSLQNERPQGAMVIMDPHTGEIKAMAGARGVKNANFVTNFATQEKRQPGSTIKPMGVYAPLIESGKITAATVFEDLPLYLEPDYHPHNYDFAYQGLTTVRKAILHSTNVVAVKAWLMLGPDKSHDMLVNRLGITSIRTNPEDPLNDRNAAMALGGLTDGVTLKEMTAAYIPLANNGTYIKPFSYTQVVDVKGNVILTKNPQQRKVITKQTAYIMTSMLTDIVQYGTAGPARLKNGEIDSAGKTGTSSGYKDRWFIGYSPYYLAGVWYGFHPERKGFPGEGQALDIYSEVMGKIHEALPARVFEEPPGIVHREICVDSGKLAGPYCALDPRGTRLRDEIFIEGTEPKETCDVHVKVKVCTESGKLATEKCPAWLVEERIMIRRLEPHDNRACTEDIPCSSETTADKPYEAPAQYCDIHR